MKNGSSSLKLTNDSVTPSIPAAFSRSNSSTIFSGRPISGCELRLYYDIGGELLWQPCAGFATDRRKIQFAHRFVLDMYLAMNLVPDKVTHEETRSKINWNSRD
jgi:hypothetical protein